MTTRPAVAVALGDSITAGVGDSAAADAVHGPGWAAHLAGILRVGTFRNLAGNGARARDLAGGQLADALRLRPDLATVLVGGNDALRSDFSPREIEVSLTRAVRRLAGAGADVVLVRLPVIGLFELAPHVVRRVMRRRIAVVNAAVDAAAAAASGLPGRVVLVDGAAAIAREGTGAWHVDRVHPSPAGHRRLALEVACRLVLPDGPGPEGTDERPVRDDPTRADLAARLPGAPAPPARWRRVVWLVAKGIPWCCRRGLDFLPGLIRAVVSDVRAEQVLTSGSAIAGIADSGLDPRKRLRRRRQGGGTAPASGPPPSPENLSGD